MKITYDQIFQALRDYYGVEDDNCVWEILNQTDDCIEDICEALSDFEGDTDGR